MGRPVIDRRNDGTVADPVLDEHGAWQAERGVFMARPTRTSTRLLPVRKSERSRPYGHSLTFSASRSGIVPDFDEIDRNSSVYVPTDIWETHAQDLLQGLTEERYADIGYDPPEVFAERVHCAWHDFVARRLGDKVVPRVPRAAPFARSSVPYSAMQPRAFT